MGVLHAALRSEILGFRCMVRVSGHFSGVWVFPVVSHCNVNGVRGVLQRVVLGIKLSILDHGNLLADADHGSTESIKLIPGFTLSRLNHEGSGDRPGHGWGMISIINQSLGNIFSFNVGRLLERSHVKNKFMGTSSIFSLEQNVKVILKTRSHVVGVEDGVLRGLGQALAPHHDHVGIRNSKDQGGSVWGSSHATVWFLSVDWWESTGWDDRVRWQERSQVSLDSDRSHSWATTTMRNSKGLVQVKMANISSNQSWASKTDLGVHVSTVHVDLTSVVVDDLANFINLGLIHTIGGWVSNHQGAEVVLVGLNLLPQVININVSLLVSLSSHNLHASHNSTCWVGSMGRHRNNANVSVVIPSALVVCSDGHESSILSGCSTVWLHRHGIKSSNLTKHISQVGDHLLVSLGLIFWGKWMNVGEFSPGDWHHLSGGVQLHGTGAQWNHRMAQGKILRLKSRQISEHLVLGMIGVENWMSQEVRSSLESTNIVINLSSKGLGSERSRASRQDGEKHIDILEGGSLIKSNRDVAGIQHTNVVVLLNSGSNHSSGLSFSNVDRDSVEEEVGLDTHSHLLGTVSHDSSEAMHSTSDFLQTFRSVVDGVHSGNVGKESLGSANVGRGLLSSDVLFTGLHGHTESRSSMSIHTCSDDTSWHDSLVLVVSGKESGVRSTISHWHSKALRGTNSNIGTELTGWGQHGQSKQVSGHDDLGVGSMGLLDHRGVLLEGSVRSWVLKRHTTDIVSAEVKGVLGRNDALETKTVGSGGADGDGLGVALVRHKELWLLSVGHGTAHGHGLSRGGSLVQQGGVGERKSSEVGDHGLEVQQRLQSSLRDLGLVWGVLSIPTRVLQQVSENHSRGEGSIVSHSNEVLVDLVLGSQFLHVLEVLVLGEWLSELSEVQWSILADVRWNGGVDKVVHSLEAALLGHLALNAAWGVTDMSRDETITWLQALDRDGPGRLERGVVPCSVALGQGNGTCGNKVLLACLGDSLRDRLEGCLTVSREDAGDSACERRHPSSFSTPKKNWLLDQHTTTTFPVEVVVRQSRTGLRTCSISSKERMHDSCECPLTSLPM